VTDPYTVAYFSEKKEENFDHYVDEETGFQMCFGISQPLGDYPKPETLGSVH